MSSQVLVFRGDALESRHNVAVAVARPDGSLAASSGEAGVVAFWRSCAKPFQALPALLEGAVDHFQVSPPELALACASHNGEQRHVETARGLLARSGAGVADLICGPHASLDDETARAMAQRGERPTPLHNNCSGKHALMIALARHRGWGSSGYANPDHPLQRRCLAEVAAWTGLAAEAVPHATDGCGVPSFALPLSAMALAWARLGAAVEGRAVPGIGDDAAAAMARLVEAVRANPFLLAGTRRLDTELLEMTGGRVVAKVGAEGVYCAALPEMGLGLALKIADGASRALGPALLAVLAELAPGLAPRLPAHESPPIRNTLGVQVGHLEARVSLHRSASK